MTPPEHAREVAGSEQLAKLAYEARFYLGRPDNNIAADRALDLIERLCLALAARAILQEEGR